jgi:hypothetical protein
MNGQTKEHDDAADTMLPPELGGADMQRREFIRLLGGAAAACRLVRFSAAVGG